MFIHPTQNRSLTAREAARVQSFPDWFSFPTARTHQFRLIGNAVPPLVAEAVGLELRGFFSSERAAIVLSRRHRTSARAANLESLVPSSRAEAAKCLQTLAGFDRRQLRSCQTSEFLRGWLALLFLFPELHPNNALDHGDINAIWLTGQLPLPGLEAFEARRFARSGWPVSLEDIGHEAWRRREIGEISNAELFCEEAQRAGMALRAIKSPRGNCKIRASPRTSERARVHGC